MVPFDNMWQLWCNHLSTPTNFDLAICAYLATLMWPWKRIMQLWCNHLYTPTNFDVTIKAYLATFEVYVFLVFFNPTTQWFNNFILKSQNP